MPSLVIIQAVPSVLTAAVRRRVRIGEIAGAWKPALDQVWAFLRTQPGLCAGGRNLFLYHHPADRGEPMDVDFGVEVTRAFEPVGEVRAVQTPAGQVASAVHVGDYARLKDTHDAIHAWARANDRTFAGHSWEVYGHWTDDPGKLETTVQYLMA
jgi:effector-binding domain-containing protein